MSQTVDFRDLSGKTVVVVGGAGGIGLAVVAALAGSGARAIGVDRTFPPSSGPESPMAAEHRVLDITDSRQVDDCFRGIADGTGRFDGLVNSAGITRDRSLHGMSDEEWRTVLSTNLDGAFFALRAAARLMRGKGSGSIVNVASINGMRGKFGQANYTASKAGLIALTRTAARELGPKGIRVNAVAPGMVRTKMTDGLPPDIVAEARRQTALDRLAEPADIAGPILFLLSEVARHVTGQVLVVDGGQTA